MEKQYYTDPYLKETTAKVVKVIRTDSETQVWFDRTIFYPECGGQPGDRGTFCGSFILDTRKADDGDSIHIMEENCKVEEGQTGPLALDWEHRYKYMVMHTCQHLLSGLLFSRFDVGTTAVHLGEDYLTIETDKNNLDQAVVEGLIKCANQKIVEGHRVVYHEMSHEEAEKLGLRRSIKVDGDVRIVEICDVDRIACGGVHAASTSEIRLVYCYGQELIRGHVRLFFRCAEDAFENLCKDRAKLLSLSSALTCSPDEAFSKLSNILTELSELKMKFKHLSQSVAAGEISSHLNDEVSAFVSETELSAFVDASNNFENLALCVVNADRWLIVLRGRYSSVDFNNFRKNLLPLIDAKGGGRTPVFQGIGRKMENVEAFLNQFLKEVRIC